VLVTLQSCKELLLQLQLTCIHREHQSLQKECPGAETQLLELLSSLEAGGCTLVLQRLPAAPCPLPAVVSYQHNKCKGVLEPRVARPRGEE